MSLARRLLEQRTALANPSELLWDALGGSRSASGVSVSVTNSLGLAPAFAAVRLLADNIGSLPLVVYEGDRRGRARKAPQWTLLHDRPNEGMPADLFWSLAGAHLNTQGDFFAEKQKGLLQGRRAVLSLWPLSPSKMEVGRDDDGRKWFRYDGSSEKLRGDTIFHIPGFSLDGVRGLSPISYCRETFGAALAREQFEGSWYGNNATPTVVLKHPQHLGAQAIENLKTSWSAKYGGVGNVGRPAVLEENMDIEQLTMPLRDMQFIEGARFSVNQIARIFRVPPEMIGGDRESSMTYSTVEGQAIAFVVWSLRPWLVRIEKALAADPDIFPPGVDRYPEFLVEGLLRGDSAARATFYKTMVEIGAMLRSEVRDRENLSPIDGIDDQLAPVPAAAPVL